MEKSTNGNFGGIEDNEVVVVNEERRVFSVEQGKFSSKNEPFFGLI